MKQTAEVDKAMQSAIRRELSEELRNATRSRLQTEENDQLKDEIDELKKLIEAEKKTFEEKKADVQERYMFYFWL